MIKIKICGITNTQDALWTTNLGADYIGLNFYSQSPRKISIQNAKAIVASLPPFVQSVGVFVDEELPVISKTVKATAIKVVQFHGQESAEFCGQVKSLGVAVWKVLRLTEPLNPGFWADYKTTVDAFLIDKHSDVAPGGTGQTFDWSWVQKASELGKPWFLSGGLNPENVNDAIKQTHPNGVDVCSGVEKSPTRKDYEKMKAFIQNARRPA